MIKSILRQRMGRAIIAAFLFALGILGVGVSQTGFAHGRAEAQSSRTSCQTNGDIQNCATWAWSKDASGNSIFKPSSCQVINISSAGGKWFKSQLANANGLIADNGTWANPSSPANYPTPQYIGPGGSFTYGCFNNAEEGSMGWSRKSWCNSGSSGYYISDSVQVATLPAYWTKHTSCWDAGIPAGF